VYWSSYQRCFREMAICAKVDYVVASTKEYLARDHSVVIGLQSTGEAGMQMALDNAVAQYENSRKRGTSKINRYSEIQQSHKKSIGYNKNSHNHNSIVLPRLLSTVASTMAGFVINHFPISHPPLEPPIIPPVPAVGFANLTERIEHERLVNEARRIESLPPPSPLPELVGRRDSFLGRITTMNLPPNALDDIIDQLGGPGQVAELTGRSSRIVRVTDGKNDHNSKNGNDVSYRHEKRKTESLSSTSSAATFSSTESERLNVEERAHFTEGTKTVAVISDASSTGISLHAERGTGSSHRRRVHFTIELPWAADKAIQQLGRSHRSGQVSAPIYHLVVTELGGERRFASAVSGRMKKLGALTKGDRRAAPGQADLAAFDVDSIYGKRTLRQLYSWLPIDEGTMLEEGKNESESLMIRHTLRQALIDVELVPQDPSSSIETLLT